MFIVNVGHVVCNFVYTFMDKLTMEVVIKFQFYSFVGATDDVCVDGYKTKNMQQGSP